MNWQKIKDFNSRGLLISRVEGSMAYMRNGYVFDRRIFTGYLILLFALIGFCILTYQGELGSFYVKCPFEGGFGGPCGNPFYGNCPVPECEPFEFDETLPRGFEIGTPPSEALFWRFRLVSGFAFFGALCALLINHFVYNKGLVPWEDDV